MRSFFRDPSRQAMAWAALGIVGLLLAMGGLLLYNRDGSGGSRRVQAQSATSTPRPTATSVAGSATVVSAAGTAATAPTPSQSPSPTPSGSVTATASPTAAATAQREQSSGNAGPPQAPATAAPVPPTPTPTAPPAVTSTSAYCPAISATSPPNSVIGLLNAPAGTSVSLAFDGVIGPTAVTASAGGYRVDYGTGGQDCANRVGAAISVVVNGTFYPTGHTVGDTPGLPLRFDIP